MHLQEVPRQGALPAVAGASGSQQPPAVAGSSNEASSPAADLAPVGSAPVVEPVAAIELVPSAEPVDEPDLLEPSPLVAPGDGPVHVVEPGPLCEAVPGPPNEAVLKKMEPPAPASPIHVDSEDDASAIAAAAFVSPAVAAGHTIRTTLLALARTIRKPRAYVGYSAFILMGLLNKCRPCAWEGASFIDLIDVFAPWANELCTKPVPLTAVPCALVAQAGGS